MDVEAFKYPLIRSGRHALKLPCADRVDATKGWDYISNRDKWLDEA